MVGVRARQVSKCYIPSLESERTEQQRLFITGKGTGTCQTLAGRMVDELRANINHGSEK